MEYLKPVEFLDADSFGVEPFISHLYLDLGFRKLGILADRGEKVAC